jgi:hypothetical protein
MEPKLPPNDPDPVPPGFPPVSAPNPDEPGPDVFPQTEPGPMTPQRFMLPMLLIAALLAAGCGTQGQRGAERQRVEQDAKSAAYKAGEAAHRIVREAEKASAAAARKLDESARKAREGWKEEPRKDQDK